MLFDLRADKQHLKIEPQKKQKKEIEKKKTPTVARTLNPEFFFTSSIADSSINLGASAESRPCVAMM